MFWNLILYFSHFSLPFVYREDISFLFHKEFTFGIDLRSKSDSIHWLSLLLLDPLLMFNLFSFLPVGDGGQKLLFGP